MRALVLIASALGMAACEQAYVYTPAENATASIKGNPAAYYDIPPAAPEGDVRLATFGFTDLAPQNAPDQKLRSVQLRMVVSNNGQTPWTFDARQQYIDIQGAGKTMPLFVTSNEGQQGLPTITIPPASSRTIDLFFPLPGAMQSASKIPEFDALWTVQTGQGPVTERTPFDRLRVEPYYYPYYGAYYGPDWGFYAGWPGPYWYNAWYPGGVWPGWWGAPVAVSGYGYHNRAYYGYRGYNTGHYTGGATYQTGGAGMHGGGYQGGGAMHGGGGGATHGGGGGGGHH
jgi:hypothetical protein